MGSLEETMKETMIEPVKVMLKILREDEDVIELATGLLDDMVQSIMKRGYTKDRAIALLAASNLKFGS